MIIKKYKETDYWNLHNGEKLCIFSFNDINSEEFFWFPSILVMENNKLTDYFNVNGISNNNICSLNENEYDFENDETLLLHNKLSLFIKERESSFLKNNAYYFKLTENDDLIEFLRFIMNENVYNYIKNVCCNNKLIKLNKLTKTNYIFPNIFKEKSVNDKIEYLTKSFNNDKNQKISNKLTKTGIILSTIITILCSNNDSNIMKIINLIFEFFK